MNSEHLAQFQLHLRQWAGVPFGWGSTDCMPFVLSYVDRLYDEKFADQWAGNYHDARSMLRFYKTNAGFEEKTSGFLDFLSRSRSPQRGHIALVRVTKEQRQRPYVGLMADSNTVLLRTANSFAPCKDFEPVSFWSVN